VAISYLKRSNSASEIEKEIEERFRVLERIEEEKDIIYILSVV